MIVELLKSIIKNRNILKDLNKDKLLEILNFLNSENLELYFSPEQIKVLSEIKKEIDEIIRMEKLCEKFEENKEDLKSTYKPKP